MTKGIVVLAAVACAMLATACSQDDAARAAAAVAPATAPAGAEAVDQAATDAASTAPDATTVGSTSAAGARACMIAGEFEILGRKIRSRDCLQAGADIPEAAHRELCEGLAQTSAQIGGGKAGSLEYMDACPSPHQGSCRGIFGQASMHAFYYERTADDLATLPSSCAMGGGTWAG